MARQEPVEAPAPEPEPEPKKVSARKPRTKAQKRAAKKRPPLSNPSELTGQLKDPPERLLSKSSTSASKNPTTQPPVNAGKRKYEAVDDAVFQRAYKEYTGYDTTDLGGGKKGRVDKHGNNVSMSRIAAKHNINGRTFRNYINNGGKSNKPGRKSIVPPEDEEFIVQHTVRHDTANDGLTCGQIIQNLQSLRAGTDQEITMQQSKNWVYRTFFNNNPDRIKSNLVKAQKTTSKRSELSVAHQYRWFKNVEAALNFLREKNTGVCRKTGKTFGELIDHFLIGADETCMMADSNGDLKIVGSKGMKKHEKKVSENRGSITMFWSGQPTAGNGPTAFLLKGKKRPPGMTGEFLVANGCEPGSCFAMTENAFMTDAAWNEISVKV